MKRIICTVTNDLSYDQRMIRICSSLANAGYKVTLLGREFGHSKSLTRQPYQQKRLHLFFNKGKLFYLEYNLRLFILLLFTKFDIVNAVDLDTLAPGFLVSRLRKKICVYDAHEYFTEVPELVERPLAKKAWEKLADFILPQLNYCYTVGDCLSQIFLQKYGVQFQVIRNLPFNQNSNKFNMASKPESPFIVLYQGALNDGRGLEEAIQAMAFLRDVELWLAGEGDLSNDLRNLAAKMELGEKVKFLGKLRPDELKPITEKAHLGLNLLKKKGLNYFYSLANKAFDYIQAGVPSLNMDFPEYSKINEAYAVFILVKNLEPSTIAQEIEMIKKDKSRYANLVENCKKAAIHFTWENEEQKLFDFYGKIK